ncbi:MAG: phosphate acyltransferase [Bacteroidales bacterium]|jgi:glycerol-3-phosphate acyltransferase PlsX|nr:phosphate acyltransferase [Bacteroidales bacterium]
MRIGIDAMGGDFAPEVAVMGIIAASKEIPAGATIVAFGDAAIIETILKRENCNSSNIEIINAPDVIGMDDHPAKAFQAKQNSSIVVGFHHLHSGKIDAFASAGSTGAMMVGAMYTIKSIQGVIRPCITGPVAKINGGKITTLLDVGLNSDCKPDVLYQYAMLGNLFAKYYYEIETPKVCLLNIGSEEGKGNLLTRAAYELMKDSTEFQFCGNIESNELYSDKVDVIVCDGFTGNVVLKQVESLYEIAKTLNVNNSFFDHFNYENHGGTPVLGVNAPVIIGHGASSAKAIKNMILQTHKVVVSDLTEKIKQAFQ